MRTLHFLLFGVLVLVGTGCAKAKAQTVPDVDGPPLAVPAAPPRQVATVAPVSADVPEPAAAPPPAPGPAPAPPRPAPRRPAEPEPRATEAPRSPRDLRPAPSAADAADEQRVRDLLARAVRDLGRVDYRRLSAEGKGQYDQSKRFVDQAESAVKDRNLPFAQTLADKAATLATGLVGR